MKNIYIKRSAVLLLVLWASGCTVFPPKVDNVPWRSEISQEGCPDVSGKYKDPEDIVFDAFYARHSRYAGESDNKISGHQYKERPYSAKTLTTKEYFRQKKSSIKIMKLKLTLMDILLF